MDGTEATAPIIPPAVLGTGAAVSPRDAFLGDAENVANDPAFRTINVLGERA